jgi:hypothetical protein
LIINDAQKIKIKTHKNEKKMVTTHHSIDEWRLETKMVSFNDLCFIMAQNYKPPYVIYGKSIR